MEESIDILAFLEKVMLKNTHSYQSDFQYDIARLRDAALESDPERRTFYWMSRPAGTWLVTERDAFLRGSNGYTIWTHYAGEPKGIRAYRVAVTGGSRERPLGTVRKLNYAQQVKRVEARALPTVKLELFFCSGQVREIAPERYKKEREWLFNEYGMLQYLRYCPENEADLAQVLAEEHRCQKGRRTKTTTKKPPQREGR